MKRLLLVIVALMVVQTSWFRPTAAQTTSELCFPETQQCITGRFSEYWYQNGGPAVFGYPITPARMEQNPDTGQSYLTQWFERNRFELHPENAPPYDVLLGRLGDDRLRQLGRNWQNEPRQAPLEGCRYFEQTGRNVCDQAPSLGFMSYWASHGLDDPALDSYGRSLALFGYPLTEPGMETNASGDEVLTQWFERARFEWHPTQPDNFKVLLGLLGAEVSGQTTQPGSTPAPALPTPVPSSPADPSVLYEANWCDDRYDGWNGPESWKPSGCMFVNDGNILDPWRTPQMAAAPYVPVSHDYAVEAEISYIRLGYLGNYPCADPNFGIVVRGQIADRYRLVGGYQGGAAVPPTPRCTVPGFLRIKAAGDGKPFWDQFDSSLPKWREGIDLGTSKHLYRVEAQGNVIRLFLDREFIGEFPDNRFLSSGQVGLWSDAAQISVHSFKVLPLGTPTPTPTPTATPTPLGPETPTSTPTPNWPTSTPTPDQPTPTSTPEQPRPQPQPPTLVGPAQHAVFGESDSIEFSWTATGDEYSGEIWGGRLGGPLIFDWQSGTSVTLRALPVGSQYQWHVKARTAGGESEWSTTRDFSVGPNAPSNLRAEVTSCTTVNLSWTDNSNTEERFAIMRDGVAIKSVGSNTTTYEDRGLSIGGNATHSYRVEAYYGIFPSKPSNTVTVTTPPCAPTPTPTLMPTPTSAPTPTPTPVPLKETLSLVPSSTTVRSGDTVTLSVSLDPSGERLSTAKLVLEFDGQAAQATQMTYQDGQILEGPVLASGLAAVTGRVNSDNLQRRVIATVTFRVSGTSGESVRIKWRADTALLSLEEYRNYSENVLRSASGAVIMIQ